MADDSQQAKHEERKELQEAGIGTPRDNEHISSSSDSQAPSGFPPEVPRTEKLDTVVPWEDDSNNPLNWSSLRKTHTVFMISSFGFVASAATSIISPASEQIQREFNVSGVVSLLPLSLYVFALGFGPVLGGPLSETLGRLPVYTGTLILGSLFTLGAGFTHNFGALCFLRFAAGFCWAPALAIGAGSVAETFVPKVRGPMMAVYVLMPFLGPGFGPVLGSFAVSRQDWRWTQWVLLFFAAFTLCLALTSKETFHSAIKRKLAKERGEHIDPPPPFASRIKQFLQVGLIRPVHMLFTEPIVGFLCLYVAINFGILFSFFAAVPYTFGRIYNFNVEQAGLVFLSVAIGCAFGFGTILFCDYKLYRAQAPNYPPHKIPPEHRLYPAMFGSFGLPIGLFWYGWTAKASISWASPAVAIVPFAWGNLCIFVSSTQYLADAYHGSIVASGASANSLARYTLAGAFPLFIIQMYDALTLSWALSLFAFCTVALLAIPWILFKWGPKIRAMSKYETVQYE